jgi:putative Mg2+ transporter-C (MgtC) family protein
MLHDLNIYIVGRLVLAAILGGAVGLERELRRKPAGLRTNILICLGAALFTIISKESVLAFGAGDPTRIASNIIPGIGFIGAGVVIRERGTIIGITSAATIFVVASIGMAVGSGLVVTAIFSAFLLLGCLVVLGDIEQRLGLHARIMNYRITAAEAANIADRVRQIVDDLNVQTRHWHVDQKDGGVVVEFDAEVTVPQEGELLKRLGTLRARCEARRVHPITPL